MSEEAPSFSIRSIFTEAVREFGSPDRGFFRTTWLMITAPGHTLRKIFTGEEKNLTSPFRYFLLAYTLFAVVYITSGANDILIADAVTRLRQQIGHGNIHSTLWATDAEISKRLGYSFYLQFPLATTLIWLGILWLASAVSFFRFQLTLGQRLTFALYFMGATTVLQLPLVALVFLHQTQWMSWISIFIVFVYMLWATQTYNRKAHRFGFVRGLTWFMLWVFMQLGITLGFVIKAGMIDGAMQARKEQPSVIRETMEK
jgi:hypothetical protein